MTFFKISCRKNPDEVIQLDGIDNDSHYEHENIRFITASENTKNCRRVLLAGTKEGYFSGESNYQFQGFYVSPCGRKFATSKEGAKFAGVSAKTIYRWCGRDRSRLNTSGKNGWSFIPKTS